MASRSPADATSTSVISSSPRLALRRKSARPASSVRKPRMKILLVHGVGHCDANPDYYHSWKRAITAQLGAAGLPDEPQYGELHYDDIFDKHNHATPVYLKAVAELVAAAAWHTIVDPLAGLF